MRLTNFGNPRIAWQVESVGAIMLRTSHLDPNVRISTHSAPDTLKGQFCRLLPPPQKVITKVTFLTDLVTGFRVGRF